jgi:isopenicillin-N N-acyltransferase-like protein
MLSKLFKRNTMEPNAFPLIEISGTAHEMGRQHGAAVPARVLGSISLYRGQMARRGVTIAQQHNMARAFMPVIEAYDPAYLEEMAGIAAGAGVAVEDIVMVNCRTEMMFGHQSMDAAAKSEKTDGCTGVVVMPEAARDGRLLHAHNWDWREECADTGVVLRIRPESGPEILTFVEAGGLARHGFNSAGVAVSGNFLSCERDFVARGEAPLGLIRRKILESPSLAVAMTKVWAKSRYCSNNLMLSDTGGEAVNLECAPDEIFFSTPENGVLVHANHWINPVAQGKLRDLGLRNSPDSIYRQRRVASSLGARAGRIGIDDLKEALSDTFGAPHAVLRSPKPGSFDSISATVATTIMDPGARLMWIARKPYQDQTFTEYHL